MRHLITALIFALLVKEAVAEQPQPNVKDAVWCVPFRYWSSVSPVAVGTGGFNFLCKVVELSPDYPEQQRGPGRFKSGVLEVIDILHADTKKFPALSQVKKLRVEGCEGLKIGDSVIVFVNSEPYEGSYVIDRHEGTNCLIGHKLSRNGDEGFDAEGNRLLLDLVKRDIPPVRNLKAEEIRALCIMDPSGVLQAMIMDVEMSEIATKTQKAEQDAAPQIRPR